MASITRQARIPTLNVNLNNVADTIVQIPYSKYRVLGMYVYDASATPLLAQLGLFTAAAGGGNAVVAAVTLTALTSASKLLALTIALGDVLTGNTLYLRNTVAQQSALNVDVMLDIMDLS